jgi:hypothetical protein
MVGLLREPLITSANRNPVESSKSKNPVKEKTKTKS